MIGLEGTIICTATGQGQVAPPGSESVACNQSYTVNVGDPDRSSMDGSIDRQADTARASKWGSGSQKLSALLQGNGRYEESLVGDGFRWITSSS